MIPPPQLPPTPIPSSVLHALLIISDSALPLGSFAYSNGLESFLAHDRAGFVTRQGDRPLVISIQPQQAHIVTDPTLVSTVADPTKFDAGNGVGAASETLTHFLILSLRSLASTALPFFLCAHRNPSRIFELDDQMDASITCSVARKASVTQGRALVGVWDRSLGVECKLGIEQLGEGMGVGDDGSGSGIESIDSRRAAVDALNSFSQTIREGKPDQARLRSPWFSDSQLPQVPSGHLAPLFALLALAHGISAHTASFVFLFSHARAVTSAAVRSGLIGPYLAQTVLSNGKGVREEIEKCVNEYWQTNPDHEGVIQGSEKLGWEDSTQEIPVMDLWTGRHNMLYSRLFNS